MPRSLRALLLLLPLLFHPGVALADDERRDIVRGVSVDGNQRIEAGTILSYLGIKAGDSVGRYDIDQGMKDLFATGFFADVSVDMSADRDLVVHVVENPMVNQVDFEGNDHLEDTDLEKEVQLKSRVIYTRPKIQADVARLLELYRRSGRFSATVKPQLIVREQNRVDVVYKIDEGPVSEIARINFIGNHAFQTGTLEEVIRSSENCWYCFITDSDKYDPDRIAYDQELLRKFYTTQGYADFQVKTATAELTPDKRQFYITFTLIEGPKYHFGKVGFETNLHGTTPEQLKPKVTTLEGSLYDSAAVETSVDALSGELGNQGFAFVQIDPRLQRHPDTGVIDLNYKIAEGPRVYVERIDIKGNLRTLDDVIRREFRLVEGDPFSTEKLQRSEQRLNNLGFFEKVNVKNHPGSAPDKTIVDVDVTEASTGEISVGAGFSTVDGVLGDFGIREKNLLGRGQELKFHALLSTQRQQYDIGFTEPYFLDREIAAGFDLFRTQQNFGQEASFDRKSNGGKLRMGYALSENLRQDTFYSIASTSIGNVDDDASRYIRDQRGTNLTSMIGQTISYDKRDNKYDPTEGYSLAFDTDLAGLGGDSKFFRPELRASYYYSFVPQWTMMLAGSGGYMFPLNDDILIQDRFFVGGRTLRGFENAGIGPRDVTPNGNNDALGGNAYYTTTAELRFPLGLPQELGFLGAAFVDAGSLWDVDDKTGGGSVVADDSSVRVSGGVGVSWKSPFGPVRIDFAKAFVKQDYDKEELIRFSFGTRF